MNVLLVRMRKKEIKAIDYPRRQRRICSRCKAEVCEKLVDFEVLCGQNS